MDKSVIRRDVLSIRSQLDPDTKKMAAIRLADRIIGHQWFYRSDTVLAFASYGSEIDTTEILKEALRVGKKLYLPKVEGEEMVFYRIRSLSDLSPGYKGIPEPFDKEKSVLTCPEQFVYDPEEIDHTLMIMPGVAFDPYKNRLGYGKGYYDRFLSDKELLQLRSIAVGYRCQAVEELPVGEHDIRPYQVILV